MHHAFDADVEHQFRRVVEEFRAVDEGEMMDLVHAARGGEHRVEIADIAADELDVLLDIGQPARPSARIVVEHAHGAAVAQQAPDQRRADEAAAAGDQHARVAHAKASASPRRLDVDRFAGCVRAARGVDQLLHAIAVTNIGLRRLAVVDGVEEAGRQPGHRRDAPVGLGVGWFGRNAFERRQPAAVRNGAQSRACNRRSDWSSTSVPSSP